MRVQSICCLSCPGCVFFCVLWKQHLKLQALTACPGQDLSPPHTVALPECSIWLDPNCLLPHGLCCLLAPELQPGIIWDGAGCRGPELCQGDTARCGAVCDPVPCPSCVSQLRDSLSASAMSGNGWFWKDGTAEALKLKFSHGKESQLKNAIKPGCCPTCGAFSVPFAVLLS